MAPIEAVMRWTTLLATAVLLGASAAIAETVRLKSTADIWLSDATPAERNSSSGKNPRLKIKNIQEMAAIRFDAAPAAGRKVTKATLFLRRAGEDRLRYVRVSTVNADWVEGNSAAAYGPADGSTYLLADAASKRPWSFPGSCFADVVMTSGNTLATWAQRKELADGWISVALTPELVYAMAAGDTDGLAVMDGGTTANFNNFIHSAQSKGSEPYIEVELGDRLADQPKPPVVAAKPAPAHAHLNGGAIEVTIEPAENVVCWRLTLDGKPVERWRVSHPATQGATRFVLEDLPAAKKLELSVIAVSASGQVSPAAKVTAESSPALALFALAPLPASQPAGAGGAIAGKAISVWAAPSLVKLDPDTGAEMNGQLPGDPRAGNSVWQGKRVSMFGGRGEYVSFQLCIEGMAQAISVRPGDLAGPQGASISAGMFDLYRLWCARNGKKQWQPAYCIPLAAGAAFDLPDAARKLPRQQNQSICIDVFIPKDARAGVYRGTIAVSAGEDKLSVPVELQVYDFTLPDRLCFWPELNAYRIPPDALDYYRIAHEHRCVANFWRFSPKTSGAAKDIRIDWAEYDKAVGPLLSGDAFKASRRGPIPQECLYLPFEDSWPTELTKQTYNYQGRWPGRGEDRKLLDEHYLKASYIGDALSQDYKDAFLSAEKQFIEHFAAAGWKQTQMQCFFGGKNTHRIDYGSNMWWTTDEPYFWDDWLAVQFFLRLWASGRGPADANVWAARADISRPQWQGRVLEGAVNTIYYGGFGPENWRRCSGLSQDTNFKLMSYGSAGPDTAGNLASAQTLLTNWLHGADGFLPWQTLGSDAALDDNDAGAGGGNALLVSGKRFGVSVVADMRLKALRDGEQLIEYLNLLAQKKGLTREQIDATIKDWQPLTPARMTELRRRVAETLAQ